MIKSTDSYEVVDCIIIESDNAIEYKSCEHFYLIQQLCEEENKQIRRIYGISEHGKSEVDHVGGIAKTTLRRQIATGKLLPSAKEMVEELEIHLEGKETLTYTIDEITLEELEEARLTSRRILYGTIKGTQTFQVVVFTPHSDIIKAASINATKEHFYAFRKKSRNRT